MSGRHFYWNGDPIPFRDGESIASALTTAGVIHLGRDGLAVENRYFCGIGACQNCLVRVGETVREACLVVARPDLSVFSVERDHV